MSNRNAKMDQDFLSNLLLDILIDILSRLPIRTVLWCKCVCKSWRDLMKTREFAKFHFSKSVPCLALFQRDRISPTLKIIEFVDIQNSGQNHYNMVFNSSFLYETKLCSSVNGLLLLANYNARDIFICNPITREYIKLQPRAFEIKSNFKFGFGVSKLSGEYKAVWLCSVYDCNARTTLHVCEVYTLATGTWSSVATGGGPLWNDKLRRSGIFMNGNLHWLVDARIFCFDLETECFSTFSTPHLCHTFNRRTLYAVGDCLCFCGFSDDGFGMWLMDKYGDEKSWRKELFVEGYFSRMVAIKVFRDGDILFARRSSKLKLYRYSRLHRGIRLTKEYDSGITLRVYTPSFLPLKAFTVENVSSF